MCIQAAFKAYAQLSKASKPGMGALHNPPMLPKAFSAIHAASGDTRQNAALAQIGPTTPVVIHFCSDAWKGAKITWNWVFSKSGVSEEDEAECFAKYERELDECQAYSRAHGYRWLQACQSNAFKRYQACRGY
jgi:hypothetical protein